MVTRAPNKHRTIGDGAGFFLVSRNLSNNVSGTNVKINYANMPVSAWCQQGWYWTDSATFTTYLQGTHGGREVDYSIRSIFQIQLSAVITVSFVSICKNINHVITTSHCIWFSTITAQMLIVGVSTDTHDKLLAGQKLLQIVMGRDGTARYSYGKEK